MTTFTESYARLADDSYDDGKFLENTPYRIIGSVDKASGYHGLIYQNGQTGEIVVAHRGTEFDGDKIRDLALADGQMARLALNQQLDGAREAVELAMQLARKGGPGGTPVSVTVTGHSLGGSLAQITAAEYGLRGETFNAYGAAGLHATPAGSNQVVNHVRASDMVSAAGQHFGNVRVYATDDDVKALLRDRAPPSRQSGTEFLMDVAELHPGKTHKMAQFYGTDSIITAKNIASYQRDKPEYDAYRDDIRTTAVAARHLPLPPLPPPMHTLNNALAASYVANKIVDAFDRNEELERLQREQQHEERDAAQRAAKPAVPGLGAPFSRDDPGTSYERTLKALEERYDADRARTDPLGATRRDPTHPNYRPTGHLQFDLMYEAVMSKDVAAITGTLHTVRDSSYGQQAVAEAFKHADAKLAQEQQAQQQALERAAAIEAAAPVRSGPRLMR